MAQSPDSQDRIVIGLVGEGGAGKDTAAMYLKVRYDAIQMRFADPIKEVLHRYFGRSSKDDQIWLALAFMQRFGQDILVQLLRPRVEAEKGLIVVNGVRFSHDETFVRSFPKNVLIYITAPGQLRWERTQKRHEKTDDQRSLQHFEEMEHQETEINIADIGQRADYRIENTGTLEDLNAALDKIMADIRTRFGA